MKINSLKLLIAVVSSLCLELAVAIPGYASCDQGYGYSWGASGTGIDYQRSVAVAEADNACFEDLNSKALDEQAFCDDFCYAFTDALGNHCGANRITFNFSGCDNASCTGGGLFSNYTCTSTGSASGTCTCRSSHIYPR